jgi:two-component system LytT family sensor kinase
MANLVSVMVPTLHLPTSPATHSRRRRWLGTRAYWLCQLIGWGGILTLWIIPLPLRTVTIRYEIIYALILTTSSVGLTHLLRITFLFHLLRPRSWTALLLRIVPWIMAAALGQAGLLFWFVAGVPDSVSLDYAPARDHEMLLYIDTLSLTTPLLLIWSGFYFGLRYYRQYQTTQLDRLRLDAAVKDAELRALKAQLNPHFLFNSLNILRALIPQNLAQPREALTLLADLLRASLNSGHEETIPLARELETVENYLALERLRFEDRLTVHRTIASPALAWPMPPFVVQTLVENAVKFGIATREAGGAIILVAAVKNGFLHLRVLNPGTIDGASVSTGLGLKNARSRLALLFGPHATLTLAQAAPDLVAAEVRLPPLAATARASAP